jgi:membrane protein implicated in regulation of membrane protease activity
MKRSAWLRRFCGVSVFLGVIVGVPVGVAALLGVAKGEFTMLGVALLLIIPAVEAWEFCSSTDWVDKASVVGGEGLVGRRVEVVSDCSPRGTVKIDGELWRAVSSSGEYLGAGRRAVVLGVTGLTLRVASDVRAGAGDASRRCT